jgi:hypothetical protein
MSWNFGTKGNSAGVSCALLRVAFGVDELCFFLGQQRSNAAALHLIARALEQAAKVLDVFAVNKLPHRHLPTRQAA